MVVRQITHNPFYSTELKAGMHSLTKSLSSDAELLSPGSILSVPSCPNDGSISYVTQSALSDISSLSNSPSLRMHSRCSGTRVTDVHISRKRFSFPCVTNANLRGAFCRKLDEIEETLNQFKVDVAFFTETWLNPTIITDLINIANYTVDRKDRIDNRSGVGVVIYAKSAMPVTPLDTCNNSDFETYWLLLRYTCMPRSVSHILLGVVYHPPSVHSASNALLYEHLIQVLDAVSRQHPSLGIFLAGDFNHFPDSMFMSYPLQQIVKVKTRGQSVLDKVFTNIKQWYNLPVLLLAFGKSDHEAVLVSPTDSPPAPRGFQKSVQKRSGREDRMAMPCFFRRLKLLTGPHLYSSPTVNQWLLLFMIQYTPCWIITCLG